MPRFIALPLLACLVTAAPAAAQAPADSGPKTRTFLFTYAGAVKGLRPGQAARVWLPVAQSGPHQDVRIESQALPATPRTGADRTYGNAILSFEARADERGQVPFRITYRVTRREVRTGQAGDGALKPAPEERISRFLQPDAKVPVGGKPLELLKDVPLADDPLGQARAFYDLVNRHMTYSKKGTGWGQGDAAWACDSKYGNCSDFHSLFIALARSQKIPAKFEMGFPIPEERGAGPVGGYHCWAWFLADGKGWLPVDISEANRHPALRDYYFGSLSADRVQFTTGRDIDLEPRQAGPPLNFFIYPYVEVAGRPYPAENIDRSFTYQDVPK